MVHSNFRREIAKRYRRPLHPSVRRRAEGIRRAIRLEAVAANYTDLEASAEHGLRGRCPFHDDDARAFAIDQETSTYRCATCGAEGDVIQLVMEKESMTFGQALDALERFRYTDELYGTS